MLLDRYRQLLTAYVDGELTDRQRRHVARLLRRSSEARRLLQQLQEDAQALRNLPRPHLRVDLTDPVLRTIADRRLTPGQSRLTKARFSAAWVGPLASWAAAAAVLLVLGLASYLYFAASLADPDKPDLAAKQTHPPSPPSVPDEPDRSEIAQGDSSPVPPRQGPASNPNPAAVSPSEVVKRSGDKPKKPATGAPPAPAKEETVLTDRLEMFRYSEVEAILPVIVKVRDLGEESIRKNLIVELRKDANFRLELPCHNGTKAFDRVQAVAKAMNLGLVIEKRAQDRLKLPKSRTNYVVYIENLTPDELAHFVQRLGAEDKKSAGSKPLELQFDRLVLTRMTAEHHKELTTLIGVDPTVSEPAAKGPLGIDPRQPLPDLTARQVGQALAGQGGTPRPDAGKSAAKGPEHFALVLAYNPVRSSPSSPEIKQFLEGRKRAKPGAIRVLLVLRS
jgi:hypothetical protein